MGEDRRSNVAGRHREEPGDQAAPDERQMKLRAKALRKRARADGHEGDSPAEIKDEE